MFVKKIFHTDETMESRKSYRSSGDYGTPWRHIIIRIARQLASVSTNQFYLLKLFLFREMILSSISFFCNLVRAAALPSTPLPNREDYGVWREAAKVRPLPRTKCYSNSYTSLAQVFRIRDVLLRIRGYVICRYFWVTDPDSCSFLQRPSRGKKTQNFWYLICTFTFLQK